MHRCTWKCVCVHTHAVCIHGLLPITGAITVRAQCTMHTSANMLGRPLVCTRRERKPNRISPKPHHQTDSSCACTCLFVCARYAGSGFDIMSRPAVDVGEPESTADVVRKETTATPAVGATPASSTSTQVPQLDSKPVSSAPHFASPLSPRARTHAGVG